VVRFWKAATAAALLRANDDDRHKTYTIIEDFIQTSDDWVESVLLWFDDEPRIGYQWFLHRVHKYFGIHPEEWAGVADGKAFVPLIASESAGNPESDWTVDDAFRMLSTMPQHELADIVDVLSEDEAYLFWAIALNERPPITRGHMLRAVARLSEYDVGTMRRACAYAPFLEVLERSLRGDLLVESPMVPGTHIKPTPRYQRWSRVTLPFPTTYYEVIRRPRGYLHFTGTHAILFSRAGDILDEWESDHLSAIYEVEYDEEGDRDAIAVQDTLYADGVAVWKESYCSRRDSSQSITTVSEMRELVSALDDGDILRLIDDVPYYNEDFLGGYQMTRHPLCFPLLVTNARRVQDRIGVRLAALDGYTPVQLAEVWMPDDVANAMRTHPNFGERIDDTWGRIDDAGCIIQTAALGIRSWERHYHLTDPEILGVDTTLGFSDTVQLSEVLEVFME